MHTDIRSFLRKKIHKIGRLGYVRLVTDVNLSLPVRHRTGGAKETLTVGFEPTGRTVSSTTRLQPATVCALHRTLCRLQGAETMCVAVAAHAAHVARRQGIARPGAAGRWGVVSTGMAQTLPRASQCLAVPSQGSLGALARGKRTGPGAATADLPSAHARKA